MDRSKQNKVSLTTTCCLSEPEYFCSSGKNSFSLGALVLASQETKPSCTCGMFRTATGSALAHRFLARIFFAESISERSYKYAKEVIKKFRREQCLSPNLSDWSSLRAAGYFFDRLNRYLSSWRGYSREKEFGLTHGRQKGQTLVELMIAMSVMSIGFLGVFAVLSQSLGLNRVAANQYIASNLAAEGIEVVKNIADSNTLQSGGVWNAGLGSGDFGVEHKSVLLNGDWANQNLKFDSNTGLYGYDAGTPTNFRRTVSITNISPDEISVGSRVRWRDRGGTEFEILLEDRFFNWRSP